MTVLDQWGSAFIKGTLRLLGSVAPRHRNRIAGRIGDAWFAVDRRHRKIAMRNLGDAFLNQSAPEAIGMLARECFKNLTKVVFEIGWSMNITPAELGRHFTLKGVSNYRSVMAQKKGALVLTAHLGNWELLTVLVAMLKIPVNVLYRPLDFGALDHFFNQYRSRYGAMMIPNSRAMRKILRALKEQGIVVILMDQNVDWYEGVFVDFFGKSACTNQGLALLALTTKAPVIPLFLHRQGEKFIVEFGEQVPLIETGDRRKDLEENTQRYTRILEEAIRRHPDQWLWVHQRWKTRPFHPWPQPSQRPKRGGCENPL